MAYKDISAEIAEIARNYQIPKAPNWLHRLQELAQQIAQWLQELLELIFKHRGPGHSDTRGISTFLQYLLYFAGAAALLIIVYLLLKRFLERKKEEDAKKSKASVSIEQILDSQGYAAEAEKLAAEGNFRGACRALYLSLLQVLHENSVAKFAPAKTNYEYRYLLAKHEELLSNFIPFAELVEEMWFGQKKADTNDYESCRQYLGKASMEAQRIKELTEEAKRLISESQSYG